MKRTTGLVAAVCLLSCLLPGGARAAAADQSLRVMSFNIRYNNPGDQENAWPHRREMVAGLVRFHGADLLGVQEALADQIEDLARLLPGFARCGVGRDDGRAKGEFSAIFYRTARFTPLACSTFWLSETPEVPGSKSWDAALTRIVTWARLRDRLTGGTFFHFNTHFDHRGVRAREESARLLVERVVKIAGRSPVIVTGDFNFNESSEGYRILTGRAGSGGRELQDARYLSAGGHYGPAATFNGFKALVPDSKIDYVFVRGGVRVIRHGVLTDAWDGRFPSDHFPVLAEVLVR